MDPKKLNDVLRASGKGGIRGLGLLAVGGGLLLGLSKSFYTGKSLNWKIYLNSILVDGGQRSIIFSRFGGVKDNIYAEGLHFRFYFDLSSCI